MRPSGPLFATILLPALLLGSSAWAQDLQVKSSTVPAMGSTAGAGSVFTASYQV